VATNTLLHGPVLDAIGLRSRVEPGDVSGAS
jgi:hypothetical protein